MPGRAPILLWCADAAASRLYADLPAPVSGRSSFGLVRAGECEIDDDDEEYEFEDEYGEGEDPGAEARTGDADADVEDDVVGRCKRETTKYIAVKRR